MTTLVMLALTLAHLLIAFACGQVVSTSPESSCPVTQTKLLSVNGCPIIVHDLTGTKDFLVEPLMCITHSLSNTLAQIDPLSQKMFVTVPVTLRDGTILAQIKSQLQSANSVNFAPVSKISISTDASSKCVQALMFLWSPDEEVGYLRLGGQNVSGNCLSIFLSLRDSIFDAINGVTATAEIEMGSSVIELEYKLVLQNQTYFYPEYYDSKFEYDSNCDSLHFIQSVTVDKCIARVYKMQGKNGRFYIEPLLCHNNNVTNEQIVFDYSRGMYYLKLDVLLQDNATLNAVQSKLAYLSPVKVKFMQLWRVKTTLSSLVNSLFTVGPLLVSGDSTTGEMRVYCKTSYDCESLRSNMIANPLSFWGHVNFELTSHIPRQCTVESGRIFYNVRLMDVSGIGLVTPAAPQTVKYQTKTINGSQYAIIQQRSSGNVSFARKWNEYEAGFGDSTNFWIGLDTIHSLCKNNVTLRVEMKRLNGDDHYQEYDDFKVGDASTNYTMTCRRVVPDKSSDPYDLISPNSGMQFSTMDRDNDQSPQSCSEKFGNGGWWFKNCVEACPNHDFANSLWHLEDHGQCQSLREIRLMIRL